MSDSTKISGRVAVGVVMVIIIFCVTVFSIYFNAFPPKIANFPQSDLSNNNNQIPMNISIYGANLLCAIIALTALIITFVAFVLPFMILTTGAFQSSFFETVVEVKSLPDTIKNEIRDKMIEISEDIKKNTKGLRVIYKFILEMSILALVVMFLLLFVFVKYDFGWVLHWLWGMLFIYIFLVICLMIGILLMLFHGEGSYPVLAEIQDTIIKHFLADREMEEEPQKIEKDININLKDINVNINLKTQDDTKKEGG